MFKFWDTVLHNREGTHPILRQKEGFLLDWVDSKKDSENTTYYPTQGEAVNKNGKIRADRIKLGRKVCLVSTLNIPLFTQNKLLPSGLEITVNLTKNFSDTILLAATTNTDKVVFDKVILRCTFQGPTEMMLNLIEEKLSHDNAVYHVDKKILSFHSISTGAQEFTIDNVFNGTLPYFFIVGIQDRTAFGNSRDKNPYTLYPMKKIQLFLNGQEHFPRPIESTDHDDTYMYDMFLNQSGYINDGDTTLSHYYSCYPSMSFNLTPGKTQNQHRINLVKSGTAWLTIKLPKAAKENTVLMVLAWYEQVVEITKNREVILV